MEAVHRFRALRRPTHCHARVFDDLRRRERWLGERRLTACTYFSYSAARNRHTNFPRAPSASDMVLFLTRRAALLAVSTSVMFRAPALSAELTIDAVIVAKRAFKASDNREFLLAPPS